MGDGIGALEELLAKQAITEVLHRYCRGLDRMDRSLADSVWHPGGTADYGPMFQGTGSEFLDWVWAAHQGFARHSHMVTNVLIEVDLGAGTAISESYVAVWLRSRPKDGAVADVINRGRYLDRWSRRGDTWAIDHRRYVDDLQLLPRGPATEFNDGTTATGRRDRSDPSFELFG